MVTFIESVIKFLPKMDYCYNLNIPGIRGILCGHICPVSE